MAITDILQSLLGGLKTGGQDVLQGLQAAAPVAGQVAAGGLGALGNAMQAQGNPLAFQAAQAALRQKQSEDFQSKQGSMLSAFQQAQLQMQEQGRQDANNRWLIDQQQQGMIQPATPDQASDEDTFELGGKHWKSVKTPMVTPPPELASVLGTNPFPANKAEPGVMALIGDVIKSRGKGKSAPPLQGYLDEINNLYRDDPTDPAKTAQNQNYRDIYTKQVTNAYNAGDYKEVDSLLGKITDQERAHTLKVQEATDVEDAKKKGEEIAATRRLPEATMEFWRQQVFRGATNVDGVIGKLGINSAAERDRLFKYFADKGTPLPIALSSTAQTHLATIESVLDSLNKLKAGIAPYKDQDSVGATAWERLKYSLGISDQAGLISLGEMDRIRGAAQALTGVRTGFNTLEQGEIHTPNFWKDSGKQMWDKVNTMIDYLSTQRDNLFKYGAKSGIVNGQSTWTGVNESNQPKKPAKWKVIDGKVQPNPEYKE